VCAIAEFGQPLPRPTGKRARRFRDARKPSPTTFRVTVETALALTVADAEMVSAFNAVTDAEPTRVEFDLEAQNDGLAARLARELLEALAVVTPSVPGGWVFASLSPV
jgi:hypothetical protein